MVERLAAIARICQDFGWLCAESDVRLVEQRQQFAMVRREDRSGASVNPSHVATHRMAERLTSDGGRARYRRRKAIVEPVIGWIKEVLGFRRFSLRGEVKARGEWNVVCLALNLKRFHRISVA